MVQSVLILGAAAPYDFEDDKGKQLRGRKIWYVMRDAPLFGEGVGYSAVSASVNLQEGSKIKSAGIHECGFEFKTNKDGKLEAKLVTIDEKTFVPIDL